MDMRLEQTIQILAPPEITNESDRSQCHKHNLHEFIILNCRKIQIVHSSLVSVRPSLPLNLSYISHLGGIYINDLKIRISKH